MRKSFLSAAIIAASTLLLSSCAIVSTPVGMATLYTGVETGHSVTSNNIGKKVGTATATNVLGIVAVGDASINKAAKDAGIKKISHVDQKQTSMLGLFSSYTTTVYGE